MDSIKTITLNGVEVQENGIIRNEKGYLIGRLSSDIDFEGEHVSGLNKDLNQLLHQARRSGMEEGVIWTLRNSDKIGDEWREYRGEKNLGEFYLEKLTDCGHSLDADREGGDNQKQ